MYAKEISDINAGCNLSPKSSIRKLNPVLDDQGILRVGGRITQVGLKEEECNPVIIPGKHHVATLFVRHYHEAVKHQGRHFTERDTFDLGSARVSTATEKVMVKSWLLAP